MLTNISVSVTKHKKKMRNYSFDDLEFPDGVVEATASVADGSQKAGATGTSGKGKDGTAVVYL